MKFAPSIRPIRQTVYCAIWGCGIAKAHYNRVALNTNAPKGYSNMDQRFVQVYDELFDRLSAQVNFYPEARGSVNVPELQALIQNAETDSGVQLRSDARYLLAVLLLQMIVVPLSAAGRIPEAEPSSEDVYGLRNQSLTDMVRQDISTLLRAASDLTRMRPISGHRMLNTISGNWSRLRVTDFRLWGD
jgi:hypothetical protein